MGEGGGWKEEKQANSDGRTAIMEKLSFLSSRKILLLVQRLIHILKTVTEGFIEIWNERRKGRYRDAALQNLPVNELICLLFLDRGVKQGETSTRTQLFTNHTSHEV